MKQKKKTASIKTTRDLAKLIGRNQSSVVRWLRRPDWNFGSFPISVARLPAIKDWIALHLQRDERKPTAQTKSLKIRRLKEQIRKTSAEADQAIVGVTALRGGLMEAAEVRREGSKLAEFIKGAFAGLADRSVGLASAYGMPAEAIAGCADDFRDAINRILKATDRLPLAGTGKGLDPDTDPEEIDER